MLFGLRRTQNDAGFGGSWFKDSRRRGKRWKIACRRSDGFAISYRKVEVRYLLGCVGCSAIVKMEVPTMDRLMLMIAGLMGMQRAEGRQPDAEVQDET